MGVMQLIVLMVSSGQGGGSNFQADTQPEILCLLLLGVLTILITHLSMQGMGEGRIPYVENMTDLNPQLGSSVKVSARFRWQKMLHLALMDGEFLFFSGR